MPQYPNILIVEDDPYLREAYIRRFARTQFAVRTASDGEEGVRLIKEQAPDLLICDIMMPGKDGWWVLQQFPKKKRAFAVLMLTNLEDEETRSRCAELGADGYLVKKDMSLHTLISTAEQFLQQKGS